MNRRSLHFERLPMNKRKNTSTNQRKQAKRMVEGGQEDTSKINADDATKVVHELQVHQIQLEAQNKELRRIQEELRQSHDRYLDLYDYAPSGYFTVNKHTNRITEVNLTACNLLGIERGRLLKTRLTEHIDPEFTDTFYFCRKRAIQNLTTEECAIRMCRGDGPSFWAGLEILVFPGTQQLRVAMLDINERKRAEVALRNSEEKLRIVSEFTYDWEYWLSPDERFVYVSPSCLRFTGYTSGEFMDDPKLYLNVIHPDDRERVRVHLRKDKHHQKGVEFEFRIIRRDGRERWMSHACQPVLDKSGNFLGRRACNRDITERKKAEEALNQSEEQYRTLYEEAPNAYFSIGTDGKIQRANTRAVELLGYGLEELVGKPVLSLYADTPDGKARAQAVFQKFLDGGETRDEEIEMCRADGSSVWVSLAVKPILDNEGKVVASRSVVTDITERKRAGETLRESQHDLNRAQAVAQIGSWRMDVQRNELTWSEENHRIFGIPPGTPMTYETFLSCVHPADRAYVDQKWQAALQGEDYDIEHRIVLWDEVRWVRERAELEFDDEGILKGGFGTTQDITQHKRMEQQLEFHDSILAQVSDIVIAVDKEQRITYYNKAAERTYHIKVEDALGRELREIYQSRWLRPEDERVSHDFLANQGFWSGENIHIKKNGEEILVESDLSTLKDESGTPIGTLVVIRDITERRKAEEQLAFHAKVLDTIEDSVVATDAEGRIIYWGRGSISLFGWKPEEVIGLNAVEILLPESSGQRVVEVGKLLVSGQSWSGELEIRRQDGSLMSLLIHSSPVLDVDGKMIGAVGVGKDITGRKKVEKIKDEFIGLVSHELKTPLTVVTGAIKTAMDERVSQEERRGLLEDAAWGADSLANILDNLLELSRYQADRLQLDKTAVSIGEIADKAARAAGNQCPAHVISLDIPRGLRPINVDPVRLERILTNLIDNACKYSPEESEVRVFVRREGNETVIGVSDQGIGIAPEDQKTLFEPFSRVGIEGRTEGIGLGLVVCKRLVEAQGGRIWVESKPGEGSTFFFTL
jgi:PAS domain S-box-containing protein